MIDALKSLAAIEPEMYLALLYVAVRLAGSRGNAEQRRVLDVIFAVWMICSIIGEYLSPYKHVVFAYMLIDMIAALYLKDRVKGRVSGIAETFFLGMILFNFLMWSQDQVNSWAHWSILAFASMAQLLCVAGGIVRHEFSGLVARVAGLFGLRGYLAFRNEKAGGRG